MLEPPSRRLAEYLLSLPERVIRSASAVAAGLAKEIGDVAIPGPVRRTRLYKTMVETTLRFLIEEVGQVEGTFPAEEGLTGNFLFRRGAGDGLGIIGMLTFHASPVWVLATLADISGAGRQLVSEIATSLQEEGMLEKGSNFDTVEQVLDGLEKTAGRMAQTMNMPPLNIKELRDEWAAIREHASTIPAPNRPTAEMLWQNWTALQEEAAEQKRTVFEVSTLMAVSAIRNVPKNLRWLGLSASLAAQRTGKMFAGALFDHYGAALDEIRKAGFLAYWSHEFQPYLKAAALQFSPEHSSLTQRLLHRVAKR